MIFIDESVGSWKQAAVACFNVLSRTFDGEADNTTSLSVGNRCPVPDCNQEFVQNTI
jgi:hypothetical protein